MHSLQVQLLNIGYGKVNSTRHNLIHKVWDDFFAPSGYVKAFDDLLEGSPCCSGDRTGTPEHIAAAARTMLTNHDNMITMNFDSRLKGYIKTWLEENGQSDHLWPSVERLIRGLTTDDINLPQTVNIFIAETRNFLDLRDGAVLSDKCVARNSAAASSNLLLRFFGKILRYRESLGLGTSRFSLSPLSKIKRHHLQIDLREFMSMIRKCHLAIKI